MNSYDDGATFEDPFVKVCGKNAIYNQFWTVRKFLNGEVLSSRIFKECDDSGCSEGPARNERFVVEALVRFRLSKCQPKVFGLPIGMTIVLEVGTTADGKATIKSHRDYWSLHRTLENAPVICTLYTFSKKIIGSSTSFIAEVGRYFSNSNKER